MISYFDSFFTAFTTYLSYVGTHLSEFPILTYIIGLVTIASAVDFIKRIMLN